MREATRRRLLDAWCGCGFLALGAGLVGYDWRLGAVVCGSLMIVGSLYGMTRKGVR